MIKNVGLTLIFFAKNHKNTDFHLQIGILDYFGKNRIFNAFLAKSQFFAKKMVVVTKLAQPSENRPLKRPLGGSVAGDPWDPFEGPK